MNGDDTLDWAKKPAVPDNRKRATIEGWPVSRFCPRCLLEGKVKPIHLFQINDEEALLMCKNEECTFMQSTYWESLIVKRSISQLSTRRKSLSSLSSRLSTSTSRNTGTHLQNILKPASLSRYPVPFNPSASPGNSSLPSLAGLTVASSRPLAQRLRTSSVTQESSLKGPERKALVPIAPFLSGHAHNFASFQTNQLEHKLLQRSGALVQHLNGAPPTVASKPKDTRTPFVTDKRKTSGKRRACSLDSDSQSSNSSCNDSRPATPETAPAGKKVRSIVVDPETLSKLIDGSMKLEIRKSKDSGADIIFRSVKKVHPTNGYSKHPEVESNKTQKVNGLVNGDTAESRNSVPPVSGIQEISSGDLEITPVGSIDDIVGSRGSLANSISYHIEHSVKSHIEIINSHIQAINKAVGCSDLYFPLDFSHLCQKFVNGASISVSSSDHSEVEKCDSLPIDCSSVVPVGQTSVPVEASADSNCLTPGKTTSEEIDFQSHTSNSYQFGDTHLSNPSS